MTTKVLTLCVIQQGSRVLLGFKKRGFGAGRWNGFGGKPKPSETLEDAACREVQEESGIVVCDLEKMGVMHFHFLDNTPDTEVHVFRTEHFKRDPIESEEMRPQWFEQDRLPYGDMWPGDKHWWPLFLRGEKFKGRIIYDHPSKPDEEGVVVEKEIRVAGHSEGSELFSELKRRY